MASLVALCLFNLTAASGGGLPEPGLVMYGAVRNAASANARLAAGTLMWTIVINDPAATNSNRRFYRISQ